MDRKFVEQIEYIIAQIKTAGYDPLAQLTGFANTHDFRYITRQGNARNLMVNLDFAQVTQYIGQMEP